MATIVEIENSKIEDLSEYLEKVLKYGGRAMSCLEHLKEEMEELDTYKRSKPRRATKDKDEEEYLRYY